MSTAAGSALDQSWVVEASAGTGKTTALVKRIAEVIEAAIGAGQDSGEVRDDVDAGAYARMLVALIQGLHVVARVEDDPGRLGDAVDAALEPLAA